MHKITSTLITLSLLATGTASFAQTPDHCKNDKACTMTSDQLQKATKAAEAMQTLAEKEGFKPSDAINAQYQQQFQYINSDQAINYSKAVSQNSLMASFNTSLLTLSPSMYQALQDAKTEANQQASLQAMLQIEKTLQKIDSKLDILIKEKSL